MPAWAVQLASEVRSQINSSRPDLNQNAKDQLMTSVITVLPQLLQQANAAQDPSKVIEAMGKVKDMIAAPKQESLVDAVKLLKEIVAPPPKDDTLITFLTKQMDVQTEQMKAQQATISQLQKSMADFQIEMLKQKSDQSNPLSQLDVFTNIFTRMTDLAAKGGGPRDWKEVVADAVTEVAPKLVQLGEAYVTQKAISDRMRPPAPTAGRPSAQPGAAHASTAAPPPAQPTAAPPAAPTPTATTPAAPNPNAAAAVEIDINERSQLINIAILASQALNLTLKGDEFAEKVCDRFGGIAYDDFIEHFDKTTLLDKLKAVPEAWQLLVEHEERLPRFIEDFYHFAEDPDDEPAPAPAPKPAKAKPKKPAAKGKKK